MNAINETIIKGENQGTGEKKEIQLQQYSKEADFLPLFINSNSSKKGRISDVPMVPLTEIKKKQNYIDAKIQSASIIAPETVFYERLTK